MGLLAISAYSNSSYTRITFFMMLGDVYDDDQPADLRYKERQKEEEQNGGEVAVRSTFA